MKTFKLLLVILLLGTGMTSQAQDIHSAYFEIADYQPGIQRIELEINDLLVAVDSWGNLLSARPLRRSQAPITRDLEFNDDGAPRSDRGAKVEYYGNYDEHKAGKIKSINGLEVDYYSNFDIHDQPGKLKSIGKISFKYNNAFDIHDEPGTLKSIGEISIKYANAFDIHDQKGNVKSIGPVKISWYNSMDNDDSKGRVKSIRGNTETIFVAKQSGRKTR